MTHFWFSNTECTLGHGDNRPVVIGETHRVEGPIKWGECGLHASPRLIDALRYAPGPILHLVTLGGDVLHSDDKSCATERTYTARFDATDLLRRFARRQALINIRLIRPYCSQADYELILRWLNTGDPELCEGAVESAVEATIESARSAVWSAAESAGPTTRSVWFAVESAVESAVWLAVRFAVEAAIESARSARSAAESAMSAAESAANDMITDMVRDTTGWEI